MDLTGAVTFYGSDVSIDGLSIKNVFAEDALNIVKSSFELKKVNITNTVSDAIDFDFSTGSVSESKFIDVGGDALDFSGSKVVLDNIRTINTADKAISVGEKTILEASELYLENAGVAVAVKDGSDAKIKYVQFNSNRYFDVMTYNKKEFLRCSKPLFGGRSRL